MAKIPRPRERTATAEELRDDAERCRRAREKARQASEPEDEGDMCKTLVCLAAWRRCCVCSRPVLFVDARCSTDGDVECPTCKRIREDLAERLRRTPVLDRVALHLRSLFGTANDNGTEARS